eukprot:scaffold616_cov306-Pavlova_lutheri.AAC.31
MGTSSHSFDSSVVSAGDVSVDDVPFASTSSTEGPLSCVGTLVFRVCPVPIRNTTVRRAKLRAITIIRATNATAFAVVRGLWVLFSMVSVRFPELRSHHRRGWGSTVSDETQPSKRFNRETDPWGCPLEPEGKPRGTGRSKGTNGPIESPRLKKGGGEKEGI